MKKFITSVLLLFTIISFAQDQPTKEQTLKWIMGKIGKYGFAVDVPLVDNGKTWYYSYEYFSHPVRNFHCQSPKNGGVDTLVIFGYMSACIPGCGIKDIKAVKDYELGKIFTSEITNIKFDEKRPEIRLYSQRKIDGLHDETRTSYEFPLILNWDMEPNLKERMIKALQALIKFNSSKEPY